MTNTYPTDCPCGSRCDGHAIGAPEDPGTEWCGVATTEGEVIYSERSPREEWVGAWKVKQETHR